MSKLAPQTLLGRIYWGSNFELWPRFPKKLGSPPPPNFTFLESPVGGLQALKISWARGLPSPGRRAGGPVETGNRRQEAHRGRGRTAKAPVDAVGGRREGCRDRSRSARAPVEAGGGLIHTRSTPGKNGEQREVDRGPAAALVTLQRSSNTVQ